jgi:hypothetical protein
MGAKLSHTRWPHLEIVRSMASCEHQPINSQSVDTEIQHAKTSLLELMASSACKCGGGHSVGSGGSDGRTSVECRGSLKRTSDHTGQQGAEVLLQSAPVAVM